MIRKLFVVVLALVLLGISVQPAAAITYGEPDAGEDDNDVTLLPFRFFYHDPAADCRRHEIGLQPVCIA